MGRGTGRRAVGAAMVVLVLFPALLVTGAAASRDRLTVADLPVVGRYARTTARYDRDRRLDLDIYRPVDAGDDPPLLVYVHGGGWSGGTRSALLAGLSTGTPLVWTQGKSALAQVRRGWVVASVDYSSSFDRPFPAALLDVKRAIRWLRTRGGYGTSPLVVMGDSAGGNLALMVAVTSGVEGLEPVRGHATVVQGAVSLDGPADLGSLRQPPWLGQTWLGEEYPPGPDRDHYGGHLESGEMVPTYLGCRRAVEPVDEDCRRRLAAGVDRASVPAHVDDRDPPVHLVCLAANVLMPDCAHDARPFAERYIRAHGDDPGAAAVDELTDPATNHFNVDAYLNLRKLEAFLDRAVAHPTGT
jgi:acetyl esterase/lipase